MTEHQEQKPVEKSMLELLKKIPTNGRFLILSFSIEGFTTNLQFLSQFYDDMKNLRADVQIWLGFRLGSRNVSSGFVQLNRNGIEWTFYNLEQLRDNIVGIDKSLRYSVLSRTVFVINKEMQSIADASSSPKAILPFGGGVNRMEDNEGIREYLTSLDIDHTLDGEESVEESVEPDSVGDRG